MNVSEFTERMTQAEQSTSTEDVQVVSQIIQKVRQEKDEALRFYSEKFDKQTLDSIKVPLAHLKASYEQLEPDVKAALGLARDRLIAYETQIKHKDLDLGEFRYVYHPLERVGVYVPGGTALYPSSVLMSVVAAQVAGVGEIHVTTPTFEANNITFATLYLLGVENVYTVGGAQAIAALAYGTESIPKVDKIVGPGNAFVALAKRLVYGEVGIDSFAGPSEILLYIDEDVNVDAIVYDVFAQAEHDANARTYVLAESEDILAKIGQRMDELLDEQPRKEIIQQSIANNHYRIVDTQTNLLALINQIAPEHVSIQHQEADEIIANIRYAGAVFQGAYSPEAIGDYIAGPSHVLPTNRTARYSHGLNVNDFLTPHAIINLTAETYDQLVDPASILADKEQLFAHRDSLLIRKGDVNE